MQLLKRICGTTWSPTVVHLELTEAVLLPRALIVEVITVASRPPRTSERRAGQPRTGGPTAAERERLDVRADLVQGARRRGRRHRRTRTLTAGARPRRYRILGSCRRRAPSDASCRAGRSSKLTRSAPVVERVALRRQPSPLQAGMSAASGISTDGHDDRPRRTRRRRTICCGDGSWPCNSASRMLLEAFPRVFEDAAIWTSRLEPPGREEPALGGTRLTASVRAPSVPF